MSLPANQEGSVMQSLFTPVETLDGSTFLRSVHHADGTISENFIMPINGFSDSNGDPVTIQGYGKAYSLFLTVDAQIANGQFLGLNATLWADPMSNDGSVSVSLDKDPAFSNGMHHDIVLATGHMQSAMLHPIDSNGTRTADFPEKQLCQRRLLQDVAEQLRTSLQVAEDTSPVSLLVIRGARV